MKQGITIRAQTVEEAVRLALEHLGLSREEVEIQVLEEPGAGPAGSEEALVQVTPRGAAAPPEEGVEPPQVGLEVLSELLRHMGLQAHVSIGEYAVEPGEPRPILDVTTTNERDSGLLIGRRGETLNRLQFLVNLLVNRKLHRWPGLLVDVEHYRRRRDASLRDLARRMAERVVRTQQPITLEPMPAYERRIIHLALRDNPQVTTQSTGEGDSRKVVIYPAGWELPPTSSSSGT
ncbi:MAG: RNA-binding cell elongation regulator Jag/EloR [Chloroflexia bacterium]